MPCSPSNNMIHRSCAVVIPHPRCFIRARFSTVTLSEDHERRKKRRDCCPTALVPKKFKLARLLHREFYRNRNEVSASGRNRVAARFKTYRRRRTICWRQPRRSPLLYSAKYGRTEETGMLARKEDERAGTKDAMLPRERAEEGRIPGRNLTHG